MDPAGADEDDSDALFGKLDSLLRRQNAGTGQQGSDQNGGNQDGGDQQAASAPVPMLTEVVDPPAASPAPDVPVLLDAVESETAAPAAPALPLDQLRLLQAALYLRLRQSVEEALHEAALQDLSATQRAQFSQALRRALPRIVRESIEQAFGRDEPPAPT